MIDLDKNQKQIIANNKKAYHDYFVLETYEAGIELFGASQQQGLSIIPLRLYIFKGRAKLEIGLCKGKKLYDKRAVQAKKDSDRAIERAMKGNY